MNRTHRSVFNAALGTWVAAPETARTQGKGSARRAKPVLAATVLASAVSAAFALPTGGAVSAGAGSVAVQGPVMTVSQSSSQLAVNWQSFNVAAGETVRFVQPGKDAIALNRVLGSDPSAIYGKMEANGQVFLLNPNGILFGKGSEVNVGGLVASTLSLSDTDFLAKNFKLSGTAGSVVNQGTLTAADGGYLALLGGQVSNQGTLTARLGNVTLAAGSAMTLDFAGDGLLSVQVDKGTVNALAENRHLIQADGGTVLLTAKAADALVQAVVNHDGVIEARTIEEHAGVIKLLGDMEHGTATVAGTLDASAPNGGNGGFIETSAAQVKIADSAKVTTTAANGITGSWLVDPVDFTIAAGSGALTTSGIGATTLSTSLGSTNVALATDASTGGNGDIFVNAPVTWSANTLTLTAHRNILINANLNGSGTAKLALEYGQASAGGAGTGYSLGNGARVNLPAGANFSTKQGSGGATVNWTVITGLGVEGDATVAPAIMTLQGMNTGLAGNYVLGADINNASDTSTWNGNSGFTPVGDSTTKFTGNFDGLGHTVTGLTINHPGWNIVANSYLGLFGYADVGSTLRNVGMLNSSIAGANVVGTLAGRSDGAIRNSYVDGGSVTASVHQAGGLVGQLGGSGSISNSYANVSVTGTSYSCCGGSVTSSSIGGLVGFAAAGSSISDSYATGSVSGGTYVGGLVGQNRANIGTSYAAGAVTSSNVNGRGGLIGDQLSGTITTSYWDSATTGVGIGTRQGNVAGVTDITAAPYAQASYTGFDFAGSWRIYEGHTRPLLRSFLTPLTVTAADAGKTYDGLAFSGGNGVAYSIVPNANLLGSATYAGSSQGATNTGSYALTPGGFWSSQRGYDITYANGTLTVSQAPLTVTANAAAKTYDGLAFNGGNGVAYSGLVNGETGAVLGGTLAYGGTAQGAVNAGTYAITASGLTSGNYAITFAPGTLTVSQAPLTVTANNAAKTYDGLAFSGGNGVAYAGFVNGETSGVLGGTLAYGGSSQGAVNAGTYALTASGLTSGNYALTYVPGTLTVNKAPLTVTADAANRTYGAADPAFSAVLSGFVNGETLATSGVTGGAALSTTATALTGVGTAAITPTQGTLAAANYDFTTFVPGTLTITPAALTVTANATSKTYDGLAYSGGNGVAYSGFVNGETNAVLGGTLAYGGTAQGAVNAGTYAITASGLTSGNYAFTYVPGTLTVNKAPLTVTADAASRTYGAADPAFSATLSGFVNGETLATSGVTGSATFTTVATVATGVGTAATTPTQGTLAAGNYDFTTFVPGTLTITPAPLTITAHGASKIADGVPYAGGAGVAYSGFVNGEDSTALSGTLAYGGDSQGAVAPGTYAISPSGLTAANYALTFADGTLAIRPSAVSSDPYTAAIASALATGAPDEAAPDATDVIAVVGPGIRLPAGL